MFALNGLRLIVLHFTSIRLVMFFARFFSHVFLRWGYLSDRAVYNVLIKVLQLMMTSFSPCHLQCSIQGFAIHKMAIVFKILQTFFLVFL